MPTEVITNNSGETRPSGILEKVVPTEAIRHQVGQAQDLKASHNTTPAQVLYKVQREGIQILYILPEDGMKPWKNLAKVSSAPLDSWTVQVGDIVAVQLDNGSDDYAKVSDLRCLDDGRFVLVYTWLYNRLDVERELEIDGAIPHALRQHLNQRWPIRADFQYMLSTNRTVALWDTAIRRASTDIYIKLCQTSIYSTTASSRHIWGVRNPRFAWMRRILILATPEEA